jgi:hypothetical protein
MKGDRRKTYAHACIDALDMECNAWDRDQWIWDGDMGMHGWGCIIMHGHASAHDHTPTRRWGHESGGQGHRTR